MVRSDYIKLDKLDVVNITRFKIPILTLFHLGSKGSHTHGRGGFHPLHVSVISQPPNLKHLGNFGSSLPTFQNKHASWLFIGIMVLS